MTEQGHACMHACFAPISISVAIAIAIYSYTMQLAIHSNIVCMHVDMYIAKDYM